MRYDKKWTRGRTSRVRKAVPIPGYTVHSREIGLESPVAIGVTWYVVSRGRSLTSDLLQLPL